MARSHRRIADDKQRPLFLRIVVPSPGVVFGKNGSVFSHKRKGNLRGWEKSGMPKRVARWGREKM